MTVESGIRPPGTAVEAEEASADASYRPGMCNIGPEEVARRRQGAWLAAFATVVLYLGLLAIGAPDLLRLVVAVPAAGAAVSWLQAHERFCVAFGAAGVFNFGPVGELEQVDDEDARRADRRKVASMIVRGAAVGVLIGIVAVLVP